MRNTKFNKRNYFVIIAFLVIFIYGIVKVNDLFNSNIVDINNTLSQEKYKVIDRKVYYVLEKEEFETSSDNGGTLIRIYMCYDGINNQKYTSTVKFTLEGVKSLTEVKSKLRSQSNVKALQLKPHTIVSSKIIKQWNIEGYSPVYEYYKESPEGLTYENLLN